jgi:hypothetical protein
VACSFPLVHNMISFGFEFLLDLDFPLFHNLDFFWL